VATGEPWLGLAHGEEALTAFQEANHSRGVLLARFAMGGNAWALGDLERAESELVATLVAGDEFALGSSLRDVFLCNVLADRGALEEAKKPPLRLIERARARGTARYEGQARLALAGVHLYAGEIDAAEEQVFTALDLPHILPLDRMFGVALSAAVRLAQGDAGRALLAAEQAMALPLKHDGLGSRPAFTRLVHAEALHASGDIDRARAAIVEARRILLARAEKIPAEQHRSSFLERVPENARTLALAREWAG
jgi:eukaryotic-like serine/threonine-protein kinase